MKRLLLFKSMCSSLYYFLKFIFTGCKINDYKGCRILLYHAISEERYGYDYMGLSILPDVFEMHMRYLKETNCNVISLHSLANIIKNKLAMPKNTVIITFDDGYKGVRKYAEPILDKYGFPATVFVTVDYIDKKMNKDMYCLNWEFMDWEDIISLKNIDIGSHALSHRRFDSLNDKELEREIKDSKEIISERIGKNILTFSYPYGAFNEAAINILKNTGYICGCSNISGINRNTTDLYRLKRTGITSFDDTIYKFKEKLLGCYDWLNVWRAIYYGKKRYET